MKHAFFFGAGASACVDMPTTDKMLDFLKEDGRFVALNERVKFKDIEQLYTYLEDVSNPLVSLFIVE